MVFGIVLSFVMVALYIRVAVMEMPFRDPDHPAGFVELFLLTILPHVDIMTKNGGRPSIYIRRFHIIRTRWFSVFIHKICRSDWARDLHDHPWDFRVLLLRGSYLEETPNGKMHLWRAGDYLRRRATWRHRVHLAAVGVAQPEPVWTLFITGKKRRSWGFWTAEGWVHNEQYKKRNGVS